MYVWACWYSMFEIYDVLCLSSVTSTPLALLWFAQVTWVKFASNWVRPHICIPCLSNCADLCRWFRKPKVSIWGGLPSHTHVAKMKKIMSFSQRAEGERWVLSLMTLRKCLVTLPRRMVIHVFLYIIVTASHVLAFGCWSFVPASWPCCVCVCVCAHHYTARHP